MSAPGRTETFMRDVFASTAMGIETLAWAEDIDLSGAAGALAPLAGAHNKASYDGDSIPTREGYGQPYLLGLMGIDESGGGTGGYLTVQGRTRAIRFGKISVVAAGEYWLMSFLDHPIALPRGNKLACVGNKSGSDAEQHVVIAVIGYSDLPRHPEGQARSIIGPVGLKTGTRVASTFGPLSSDVLGDHLAYEDSEEALSTDDSIVYQIEGLINGPGLADTGLVGVHYQAQGNAPALELYIPASMGGSENYWLWPPIQFGPAAPAKLGAFGASTTSDEYGFHLGSSLPYGDYDAGKTGGGVAGGTPPRARPGLFGGSGGRVSSGFFG